MKSAIFSAGILLGAALVSFNAKAQSGSDPYYVVIGAFSSSENAAKRISSSRQYNLAGVAELNPGRQLHYVYVMKTDDRAKALVEAERIRKGTRFTDTWVYTGLLGEAPKVVFAEPEPVKVEPVQEVKPEPVVVEPPKPVAVTRSFVFAISDAESKRQVLGEVHVTNATDNAKIGTYRGNQPFSFTYTDDPGTWSIMCDVTGYRKWEKVVPAGSAVANASGQLVIPVELVRMRTGELSVAQIFFFKDATVMLPDSKMAATELLEWMRDHSTTKIRIHGHTNGNAKGTIISMKKGSMDYFSLDNTEESKGSAKTLSQKRAETLKNYLVSQGIDHKRIEIKAWGGDKPLYEILSEQAEANVRVEIEIIGE
jgi:outer membrane protein OmpA-like peptidoglycan-associated protein